jgi:soluble lytic murein transglycosylase-like protein
LTIAAAIAFSLLLGPIQMEVRKEASEQKVPFEVVAAIIAIESRWRPNAIGLNIDGSKDRGIMQLNDRYFNDGDDFWVNIHTGIYLLSSLYRETKSWYWTFYAYNAGLRSLECGAMIQKSREYADRVWGVMVKILSKYRSVFNYVSFN